MPRVRICYREQQHRKERQNLLAEDMPVIVVGGGAALCGDTLPGASEVIRPQHADVANAVGAAIAQAQPVYHLRAARCLVHLKYLCTKHTSCGLLQDLASLQQVNCDGLPE